MWLGGSAIGAPAASGSAGSRRQRVAGLCNVGDGIGACSRVANGCFPYPAIDLGEHVCRNVLLTHWAFAYSNSGRANGVMNPPLTAQADSAVGGNGIHGLAFPTLTYEATNGRSRAKRALDALMATKRRDWALVDP
jgi:hypothetical protein